jgi:ribonuclease P protein component
LSGKNFLLRAGVNGLAGARLGLIASRKAARRAVDRNRGKRLAREAFRAARATLPGLTAVDVVLQLKNDLRKSKNPGLRKELDRLLRDAAARFGAMREILEIRGSAAAQFSGDASSSSSLPNIPGP